MHQLMIVLFKTTRQIILKNYFNFQTILIWVFGNGNNFILNSKHGNLILDCKIKFLLPPLIHKVVLYLRLFCFRYYYIIMILKIIGSWYRCLSYLQLPNSTVHFFIWLYIMHIWHINLEKSTCNFDFQLFPLFHFFAKTLFHIVVICAKKILNFWCCTIWKKYEIRFIWKKYEIRFLLFGWTALTISELGKNWNKSLCR